MKIQKHDGDLERLTLIGMVTDPAVVSRIAPKWEKPGLFASPVPNTVGGWCVEHHLKYGGALGRGVQAKVRTWEEEGRRSPEEVREMEDVLVLLSDEYERNGDKLDPEFVLDRAGEVFNKVRLTRLAESLRARVEAGQLDEGNAEVTSFRHVELGVGAGIDLLLDEAEVRETFSGPSSDVLVEYPGALGQFFNEALERDGFVAFMGPEKSGKSWWLLDVAWRAMCQRRRVAYFQVGDMSKRQFKRRLTARAARHPFRSTSKDPTSKWPCKVKIPTEILPPPKGATGDDATAEVVWKEREFTGPLDADTAWKACQKVMKKQVRSGRSYFKLSVHPNRSVNVAGVKSVLHSWGLLGWHPDVVVIDYADVLSRPEKHMEKLEEIDATWDQLRGLSQELHCLVVTATQVNAESYKKRTLDRSNFSGNHLKLAHVTGMVGINVAGVEKERQVCRLNWIELREGEFSSRLCVHVAQCLPLANPAVRSTF